jgi:hypothetical protein
MRLAILLHNEADILNREKESSIWEAVLGLTFSLLRRRLEPVGELLALI